MNVEAPESIGPALETSGRAARSLGGPFPIPMVNWYKFGKYKNI